MIPHGEGIRPAAAGVLLYVALVLALFHGSRGEAARVEAGISGSTYSNAPHGLARLFEALRGAGAPVHRLTSEEIGLASSTVLIVEPERLPSSPAREALATRLSLGLVTVVVAGNQEQLELAATAVRLPGEIPPTVEAAAPARVTVDGLPLTPLEVGFRVIDRPDLPWSALMAFTRELPEGRTLLRAADGEAVAIAVEVGNGLVVLVSEPRLFENGWIDQAGNLDLVLALIGGRAQVLIDERWHGGEDAAGDAARASMASLLYATTPGTIAVFVVLTVVLGLYLTGIHPGGPALTHRRRRNPTELIDALATLSVASGRGHDVLRHFQHGLAKDALRRYGLPPDVPIQMLAERLARASGEPASAIEELLMNRPAPRSVPAWVNRLDQLRKKVGL